MNLKPGFPLAENDYRPKHWLARIQAVERALQASDAHWSAIFDAVGGAIFLTDANYTILKCNRVVAEMWQRPPEVLVEKNALRRYMVQKLKADLGSVINPIRRYA